MKVEKDNDNGVKYNFVKKKSKFINKSSRERVAKHLSTDKGREKLREVKETECQNHAKVQKEKRSIVQKKEIECQNYAKLQKEKRNIVQMKEI